MKLLIHVILIGFANAEPNLEERLNNLETRLQIQDQLWSRKLLELDQEWRQKLNQQKTEFETRLQKVEEFCSVPKGIQSYIFCAGPGIRVTPFLQSFLRNV